jgi:molecular chaperone GrpE
MNTEPEKKPADMQTDKIDTAPEEAVESFSQILENADELAAAPPADLAAARVKALEAELADAKDKMVRALAEAENARRRAVKDREDAGKYAVTNFARDLLDFSDNFQRALAAIPAEARGDEKIAIIVDGLQAMEASLLQTLQKHGIRKIDPLDEPFNPNFHEVMFEAPVAGKTGGTVIQVIEPGYVIADRLLRAAKVGIAKSDSTNHQVDQKA